MVVIHSPISAPPPSIPYTNTSITHEYLSPAKIYLLLYLEDVSLKLRMVALKRAMLTHTYRLYPEAFSELTS